MGRPPLPDGKAKDIVFTLRLSESERDALATAAKRAAKPVTQWAREALLELAKGDSP
jgi:predicted HicB family RNase H-like nuclease